MLLPALSKPEGLEAGSNQPVAVKASQGCDVGHNFIRHCVHI